MIGMGFRRIALAQGLIDPRLQGGADGPGLLTSAVHVAGSARSTPAAAPFRAEPGGDQTSESSRGA